MLEITEAAMDALKQLRTESEASGEASARFQPMATGTEQRIGFAFSDDPVQGDQKVADDGQLKVYLAPELTDPLTDAVVDARASGQGTELFLREQESPEA